MAGKSRCDITLWKMLLSHSYSKLVGPAGFEPGLTDHESRTEPSDSVQQGRFEYGSWQKLVRLVLTITIGVAVSVGVSVAVSARHLPTRKQPTIE
jgi:hypothetical protein